jgi:hypothetical protein
MTGPLALAEPSEAAKRVVDDLKLDFVSEIATRAAGYARHAASAARHRDKLGVRVRLRQARLCLRAACRELREPGQ